MAAAAVAAVNLAPASAHAATPCTNPDDTAFQGYVVGHYVLLQYERVDAGTGAKVCYQLGGTALGPADTYGVVDIPLPSASAAPPKMDNNSDACMYFGGRQLAQSNNEAGRVRVSYHTSTTDVWVCLERWEPDGTYIGGLRYRVFLPAVDTPAPTVGTVTPAPARDTSYISQWRPGAPSNDCEGPGSTTVANFYADNTLYKLTYSGPLLSGAKSVCVRRQESARSSGGKVTVDAGALPRVTTSSDLTPCTRPLQEVDGPDGSPYLHIGYSPLSPGGTQSVCVSTSHTSGTRLQISPVSTGVVTFTPDPGTL